MFWVLYGFCIAALIAKGTSVNEHTSPPQWHAHFFESSLEVHMGTVQEIFLLITDLDTISGDYKLFVRSDNPDLASVDKVISSEEVDHKLGKWSGSVNVTVHFLGQARIFVELKSGNDSEKSMEFLNLVITRKMRPIDHAFTGSVALLVSLLYINFGAALDLTAMRGIFMRPIGPAIGFFGQFVIMPLCSYALGYALFPDMVELHLGLFFTGVSPGGGASNIWTVILQGNIHLSIVMTTISNFAAFGMMPFWIFTLGKLIFDRGNLGVPYDKIAIFALALIIPLGIGIAIQKFFPRISRFLIRILKPISVLLILFIIIFAIVTNLYMFKLFSWKIILAGLSLPFFGYTLSWCIAKFLKQSRPDALAIAIETGIQNTGIAIFLLKFTLPQPQADLTTVIPVAVAIMTPFPLFILYIVQKFWKPKNNTTETTESIIRSDAS